MKKSLIIGAMASMMLLTTSCQEDFLLKSGKEAVVSFNLETPQITTRLYSDGTSATRLQYAVYDEDGNELTHLTNTNDEIDMRKTVNFKLTTGNTYTVVFWASSPNAPYNVDFANKQMTVDYDAAKTLNNDESRDAFFNDTTFTVAGSVAMEVELRRPFAQLNIGTNDYIDAEYAGYTVTQTGVTAKVYNTLSLVRNAHGIHEVVGDPEERFFALKNIPDETVDGTFPVDGFKYLSMTYLLVPTDQMILPQLTMTYTDGVKEKTRTFGQIPVQRNYRTNIYGQLLTSNVEVYIEIIPDYYKPDYEHVVTE